MGCKSLGTGDGGKDEEREEAEEEGGNAKPSGDLAVIGAGVEGLRGALGEAVGHAHAKVLNALIVGEGAQRVFDALVDILSPGVRAPVQAPFTLKEELGALSIHGRASGLALGDRIPGLLVEGQGVGFLGVHGRGVVANGRDAFARAGSVANVCPSGVDDAAYAKNEGQGRAPYSQALADVDALFALPLALLRLDHASRLSKGGGARSCDQCPPNAGRRSSEKKRAQSFKSSQLQRISLHITSVTEADPLEKCYALTIELTTGP